MACGSCNKKKPKREPVIAPVESNAYVEGVNGYVTVKYIGAIQRRLIGKFTEKVYLFSPDTFRAIDLNDCEAFLSLYDNDFVVCQYAAAELGKMGDPKAVPDLLKNLVIQV